MKPLKGSASEYTGLWQDRQKLWVQDLVSSLESQQKLVPSWDELAQIRSDLKPPYSIGILAFEQTGLRHVNEFLSVLFSTLTEGLAAASFSRHWPKLSSPN
jgi:hypothetical protein